MKYDNFQGNCVQAVYGKEQGNPYLEAMPELMGKRAFEQRMKSQPNFQNSPDMTPEERRNQLSVLSQWFQPIDYMYTLYDMLYRAMASTYRTKTVMDSVRRMNELYQDFRTGRMREAPYSTQAYSGAVLGVPGIGKTSTLKRCLSIMPQVVVHREYQGQKIYEKQINYLMVECPSDCSLKTLALNIFSAIDRAIGSEYFKQAAYQKAVATSATTTKLKIICMNHHIGLIVIDEIQNAITTAARNKQMKPLIKFLVELTNETSTALCFCGTLEAEEVFLKQEHLKRRTRGFRLLPMRYDKTYRKFITELWEYQMTLQKAPLTEKLMKQMYDLSAGIPAYMVKIFEEAQVRSILSGCEKLSYESIRQAVDYLGIEVPKIYGRGGTSVSDFSVNEVEAVDFTEEVEQENKDERPLLERYVSEKTQLEEDDFLEESIQKDKIQREELSRKLIKRFYAQKRGRKKASRDETDLIELWNQGLSEKAIFQSLESWQMAERRCY